MQSLTPDGAPPCPGASGVGRRVGLILTLELCDQVGQVEDATPGGIGTAFLDRGKPRMPRAFGVIGHRGKGDVAIRAGRVIAVSGAVLLGEFVAPTPA